ASAKENEQGEIQVRLSLYWRPSEAKPSRRRRLLTAEVFRTACGQTISPNLIAGKCIVLPITQFIRTCAKRWGLPTPFGVEFEERMTPFVPTRLPPSEPLECALEQVDVKAFADMTFPISRPHHVSLLC
ncbi:unnamed protein product, partial [Protopolystoma xenopodis]